MARRGDEYFLDRRVADRGNDRSVMYSRARGEDQLSTRRVADRGSGRVGPDPRDLEIKRLRQRVRDLEIKQEIRRLKQRIRDLELSSTGKETVTKEPVGDVLTCDEEHPTNGKAIYDLPPVYDEYDDEEWYSWINGGVIENLNRKVIKVYQPILVTQTTNPPSKESSKEFAINMDITSRFKFQMEGKHISCNYMVIMEYLNNIELGVDKLVQPTIIQVDREIDIYSHINVEPLNKYSDGPVATNLNDICDGLLQVTDYCNKTNHMIKEIQFSSLLATFSKSTALATSNLGFSPIIRDGAGLLFKESFWWVQDKKQTSKTVKEILLAIKEKLVGISFNLSGVDLETKLEVKFFFRDGEKEVEKPSNRVDRGPDNQYLIEPSDKTTSEDKLCRRVRVVTYKNQIGVPFDPGGFKFTQNSGTSFF